MMIVPNQKIKISWNSKNKVWYESKGYHFTKNGDYFFIDANDILPSNNTIKIKFICDYCGKEYETFYANYYRGMKTIAKCCCGDPECRSKKSSEVQLAKHASTQYAKFVNLCKFRGYSPVSTIDDYKGSHSKLKYRCPKHGVQEVTPTNFIYRHIGCPDCAREELGKTKRVSVSDLIELVSSKNGDKILNPEEYINSKTSNLQIQCGSCKKIFTTSYAAFKSSSGKCRACAGHDRSVMKSDEVKQRIYSHNHSILFNPEDYKNISTKNLRIKCGKCGTEYISSLANVINSHNTCPKCSTKVCIKLSPDEVSKRVNARNHNELLNPEEYISVFEKNLKVRCGSCGKIFITSLSLLEGSYDGKCRDCSPISVGEEMIADILDRYGVSYIRQKTFNEDCRDRNPLPFDFYLPPYNLCIEFDGLHHIKPVYGDDQFKSTKLHDSMKDWYCRWNNIDLLRIPYWERTNIEQILTTKLDLSSHEDEKFDLTRSS